MAALTSRVVWLQTVGVDHAKTLGADYFANCTRAKASEYNEFMCRFVRPVVGANIWDRRCRTMSTEGGMSTPSDEAIALLLLENNWDRWIDIYTRNGFAPCNSGRKRSLVSDVLTLYTHGGKKFSDAKLTELKNKKQKVGKGWSREGVARYNELFQMVKNDREAHPQYIKQFLAFYKRITPEPTTKGKRKTRDVVMPIVELGPYTEKPKKMAKSKRRIPTASV